MAATTERTILAGGCFWGMQQLVRRLPGVVSTRVGYSGGDVKNATYRQPRHARRSDRDHVRPESDELPRPAGVLLPDPRPDDAQPAGKRPRHKLQVGDFLHERGTTPRRRGHHRRRRGLRAVAGQGRDRALARWRFLGGGARAPGLPGTLSERLHLPLRPSALEVATEKRRLTTIAVSVACGAQPHCVCIVVVCQGSSPQMFGGSGRAARSRLTCASARSASTVASSCPGSSLCEVALAWTPPDDLPRELPQFLLGAHALANSRGSAWRGERLVPAQSVKPKERANDHGQDRPEHGSDWRGRRPRRHRRRYRQRAHQAREARQRRGPSTRATRISSTSGWSPTSRGRGFRLSANAAVAVTFEEEQSGKPI